MRLRRFVVVVAVVLLAGSLAGCGNEATQARDELRDAIARTRRSPFKLVYEEKAGETAVRVLAAIGDDLRYKAGVELGGTPAVSEVVVDDAVAVRVDDAAAFVAILEQGLLAPGPPSGENQAAADVLRSGRWVVDPVGAPEVRSGLERAPGHDVVLDAVEALDYVEQAVRTQPSWEFNPDDVRYRPKEDPFPHPDRDAGVKRFDLGRPRLPNRGDAEFGGTQSIPTLAHFRKMSVYVRDGVVVTVRESVTLDELFDDLRRTYDMKISEAQEDQAIELVNTLRTRQGQSAIRLREMIADFREVGVANDVALPDGAVTGTLTAVLHTGPPKAGSSS